MGYIRNIRITAFFLAIFVAGLAGCADTNRSAYSVLDTIAPTVSAAGVSGGKGPVVAVGPIDVPGYVDRAVTVLESTINSANISAFDQKVYVLKTEIPRVITENLRVLFAPVGVTVVPYARNRASDYRVAVGLATLDITKFDLIETKAQWALYGSGGTVPLMARDISFNTPVKQRNDAGIKAAVSKALADLSRSIAQTSQPVIERK